MRKNHLLVAVVLLVMALGAGAGWFLGRGQRDVARQARDGPLRR